MGSNCRVIPQHLFRLDRTLVTAPAYAFEVGRIVEQGQVAFMRFDVENNGRAWVRTTIGQGNLAPLKAEVIARQYKSAKAAPLLRVV